MPDFRGLSVLWERLAGITVFSFFLISGKRMPCRRFLAAGKQFFDLCQYGLYKAKPQIAKDYYRQKEQQDSANFF